MTANHIAAWREILAEQPGLNGPHFAPELARIYGEVRSGATVCLVREGREIVGFLPVCRQKRKGAGPIGGHLSDFQGAVFRSDICWSMKQVLRDAGFRRFQFSDWISTSDPDSLATAIRHDSPYIDLSQGFEAYRVERRRHTRELQEGLRKSRKLSRDHGDLRLEPYCNDRTVLTQLLKWKADQMLAAKKWNALTIPWTRDVFDLVLEQRGDQFAGMLTALWAGDELVAATMGMRTAKVLHGWVTAYSPKFAKYSPGLVLVLEVAQHAQTLGIERIDMGRGDESFKRSFSSGAIEVHEGVVDTAAWSAWLHLVTSQVREMVRNTWFGRPLRTMVERARFAARTTRPLTRKRQA